MPCNCLLVITRVNNREKLSIINSWSQQQPADSSCISTTELLHQSQQPTNTLIIEYLSTIDHISVPAHVRKPWRGKHTYPLFTEYIFWVVSCFYIKSNVSKYIRLVYNRKKIQLKHTMLYGFSYGMESASVGRSKAALVQK